MPHLSAQDISRITRKPLRSVRWRMAKWLERGYPLVTVEELPATADAPPRTRLRVDAVEYAHFAGLELADLHARAA